MAMEDAYNKFTQGSMGQAISSMHDAARDANLANMEGEYNRARSQEQADAAQISKNYQQQSNSLGAQYERQRRNANLQAAANGLNTGAASQMQLAQNAGYQRAAGQIGAAQAADQAASARRLADLEASYKSQINAALANADYQKAAALMQGYEQDRNHQTQMANTLAQYGDFSGYGDLATPEQIASMTNEWNRRRQIEDDDRAYSREQDAYNRQWNEELRDYNRGRDAISDQRYADELAYSRGRDAINDERYADELAYNRAWNEDARNYSREQDAKNWAWQEDERNYNRQWNQDERDYARAFNEDERNYTRGYNEESRDYNRALNEAQTRASYGDFSGFEKMGYSKNTIDAMREIWTAQNPLLAYNTGAISAERYRQMTGQNPPGASTGGSGASYGGSSGSSGSSGSTKKGDTGSDWVSDFGSALKNAAGSVVSSVANNAANKYAPALGAVAKGLEQAYVNELAKYSASGGVVQKPSATTAYPNIDLVKLMGGRV